MDKKGATTSNVVWGIVGLLVVAAGIAFMVSMAYASGYDARPIVWLDSKQVDINWNGPMGYGLTYVFGVNEDTAQSVSAMVVLLAIWVIFFLAFADTIDNYGFFKHAEIAWVIGAAMAIVLANLGFYYNLLVNFMGFFVFFAGGAVIASLVSIFVVMFATYWGMTSMGKFLIRRRAMQFASEAQAGGTQVAGTIKGLKEIGTALKKGGW